MQRIDGLISIASASPLKSAAYAASPTPEKKLNTAGKVTKSTRKRKRWLRTGSVSVCQKNDSF